MKTATFADIFPVKQISSHKYSIDLEDAWCIGTVPNGGYVTSAFLVAARTHMQMTHASRKQSDIISVHLEFMRRTSVGPAIFTVKDLKIGSRISNLHLTLSQPKDTSDPNSPTQDEVEGYISISSIPKETGPSHVTDYQLSPAPLPAVLSLLPPNQDGNYIRRRGDPFDNFRRAHRNLTSYLVKPFLRPQGMGPSIADQWVQFTPVRHPNTPGRWTNDALGFLVDIFPQLHERYVNSDLEDMTLSHPTQHPDLEIKELALSKKKAGKYAAFWYPTLLLNLDVKKKLPDEGVEWLFVRVQAKKIQNGRFDLSVEVWDDPINGELVALSTHMCLVLDASRNTNRGKKDESKGGGGSKL